MSNFLDLNYGLLVRGYRIEPRSRDDDWSEGLKAKWADPAWTLCRQWMLGEFQAENAGSLIKTVIDYNTELIKQYAPANEAYLHLAELPLEVLVEREEIEWDWRMRIRVGQQFERIVRRLNADDADILINNLRTTYGILPGALDDLDEQTSRFVKLMMGRTIDGNRLWGDRDNVDERLTAAVKELDTWYKKLYSQPDNTESTPWKSNTLEYHFRLKGEQGTELISNHYRNGDLEWHSSNIKESSSDTEISSDATEPLVDTPGTSVPNGKSRFFMMIDTLFDTDFYVVPTHAKYSGMYHPRYWALEDQAVVDFAKMDVSQTDLIRTMLMNYGMLTGDDHYVVPLNLPISSLTTVQKITTTDVFGFEIEIENGRVNTDDPLMRWDLFSLSKNEDPKLNAAENILYLPPSSGFREESEALEWLQLARDEDANLVWGIEKFAPNGWGIPVSVAEKYLEKTRRDEEADTNGENGEEPKEVIALDYKLATKVPEHWIPYLPERIGDDVLQTQVFLKQARLPSVGADLLADTSYHPPNPQTRVLQESEHLNEETITRAGIQVKVTKQRLRWVDGKTYVWTGRNVILGQGEKSSGLEHDVIKDLIGLS